MANSKLIKKNFTIPEEIVKHLKKVLNNFKGNKRTDGYARAKEIINSKGIITYEVSKRIKNWFDKNKDLKGTISYELNGGDIMKNYIDELLNKKRKQIKNSKEVERVFKPELEKNPLKLSEIFKKIIK